MRIMIVDDEKPIRQWFEFCIERIGAPFVFVGGAGNGAEALRAIPDLLPDVVVTDITMPRMDGMEFMSALKEQWPSVDVVVLTCHAEFGYARDAMKLGAYDYLLKAEAEDKDLRELLLRIREKRAKAELAERALESQLRQERDRLMAELAEGRLGLEPDALRERFERVGVRFGAAGGKFALALHPDAEGAAGGRDALDRFIEGGSVPGVERGCAFRHPGGALVLIGELSGVPSMIRQMDQLRQAAQAVYRRFGTSIGISRVHQTLPGIAAACEEAVRAMQTHFYKGVGAYFAGPVPEAEASRQKERLRHYGDGILEAVRESKPETIVERTKSLFRWIRSEETRPIESIFTLCSDIIRGCLTGEEAALAEKELRRCRTLSELERHMLLIADNTGKRLSSRLDNASPAVARALKFIDAHYERPISLADAAEYAHLNPNYFSQLFKEETGENFSAYLVSLRMKKAEELLQRTSMKTYEIAERVGYPNVSYFSKKFKEFSGRSPFEYRRGEGAGRPERLKFGTRSEN